MTARARPRAILALAGAAMLALRLALVAATADVDTDAYGHFNAARDLLHDPTSLSAHWVWLPAYHYLVWALIHLGLGFTGVRVVSALVQAVTPFVLHDYVARRGGADPGHDRRTALLAALAFTAAPLSNRLATSAQAETWFTLLVLLSAWAVDDGGRAPQTPREEGLGLPTVGPTFERRRSSLAGALLAGACLMRYEAWGALPALAIHRLLRKKDGPGIATILIPAAAVAGWIVLRRHADGEWLSFVGETRRFAAGVRAAQGFSPIVDGLLLPLALPPLVLGPAIVLVPLGLRRSLRAGWSIPGGILAFLVASYLGHGALGLERYLTALLPFACVALADGARRASEIRPRLPERRVAGAALIATGLTTAAHLGWMVHRARAHEGQLRTYEAEVERR